MNHAAFERVLSDYGIQSDQESGLGYEDEDQACPEVSNAGGSGQRRQLRMGGNVLRKVAVPTSSCIRHGCVRGLVFGRHMNSLCLLGSDHLEAEPDWLQACPPRQHH